MWKQINISQYNIELFGNKSLLIKCPNNSDYKGYSFWHPIKCTETGLHKSSLVLLYTNQFSFKLIKYGKGKHNKREVIDSVEIDVDDFETMFNVMSDNIRSSNDKNDFETHKPAELEATKVEANDELLD